MQKLFLVLAVSLVIAYPAGACISPGGTDDAQQIMNELNAGRTALLCANTTWWLNKTVVFPPAAHDIYIMTEGNPNDNSRAKLYLYTSTTSTAIRGNDSQPNIQLRNLIIDGYYSCGSCNGPLVQLGGARATGQIVDACVLRYAQGWSHLEIQRGDDPGCRYAQVTNNDIGPKASTGVQYTDGLSLQCASSTVFYNYIHGFTDGGIVVFGAPGSDIYWNDIETPNAISGIALVDHSWNITDPYVGGTDEDFSGTRVHDNTIKVQGPNGVIFYGIAIGQRLLDCLPGYSYGGSVTNNSTQMYSDAKGFIYAYAIDGVSGFTVTGNTNSAVSGDRFNHNVCDTLPLPSPGAFRKHNADIINSTIQADFVDYGAMHQPTK